MTERLTSAAFSANKVVYIIAATELFTNVTLLVHQLQIIHSS